MSYFKFEVGDLIVHFSSNLNASLLTRYLYIVTERNGGDNEVLSSSGSQFVLDSICIDHVYVVDPTAQFTYATLPLGSKFIFYVLRLPAQETSGERQ